MADFKIQRGSITISSATTGTITAGVDYTAPASIGSSFIRIVGLNNNGSGASTSDFAGAPDRNNHVISNPSNLLTSITFERSDANVTVVEVFYEIIEYIGAVGGDHEFIVRHEEAVSFTTTGTTIDSSTFGSVATAADVVVFNTGNRNNQTARGDGGIGKYKWEYVSGSTLARGTRDVAGGTGVISIACVEFTGSAWTVQRIDHAFTASATNETETISSVGDVSRAFTHYQSTYATDNNGPDGMGFEAYLSSATQLTFNATNIDAGMNILAWVVSNSQTGTGALSVERISGSRADNAGGGTDPDSWTESHSTSASDTTTVSILGETGTSNSTSDCHLVAIGFEVNSTTVIDLLRGRDEANRTYRFEVVTWPEEVGGGTTLTAESGSYVYSGAAINLVRDLILTAESGAYIYSGTDVLLSRGLVLDAESGVYLYTGTDAGLIASYKLIAESGSYIYTGSDAGLIAGYQLIAENGSYIYTGTDVTLTYTPVGGTTLTAESGTYIYSGTDADLLFGANLSAESGAYLYSGTDVSLVYNVNLIAESGSYLYAGTAIETRINSVLNAESGTYIFTGTDVSLNIGGRAAFGAIMYAEVVDTKMVVQIESTIMIVQ